MAKQNDALRQIAHRLYLQHWTGTDIARLVDVSEQTLSAWVTAGGWKDERIRLTASKKTAMEHLSYLYNRNLELLAAEAHRSDQEGTGKYSDPGVVDLLAKMFKQLDNRETSWERAVNTLREFANYVSTQQPGLLETLTPLIDQYVVRLRALLAHQ